MKNFHAGYNINQGHYKSFEPSKILRKWHLEDNEIQ